MQPYCLQQQPDHDVGVAIACDAEVLSSSELQESTSPTLDKDEDRIVEALLLQVLYFAQTFDIILEIMQKLYVVCCCVLLVQVIS